MEEIIFIFYGIGNCLKYQAYVNIYNSKHELVFSSNSNNGKVSVCLPINQVYTVQAIFQNQIIISNFYVDIHHSRFVLFFPYSLIILNKVTFYLKDYFYDNLNVEKGEIILWPKI